MSSKTTWRLAESDLDALLRGLEIMGTGGGGVVEFGREIIENDLRRGRVYEHVSLQDVPDDALVVSGGIMGSVKVLDQFSFDEIVAQWEERFEPLSALRAMEETLGQKVDFIIPFELGGLNTPVIQSLGARAGIPVIDGDGVGRAAPETQMTSFSGHGISLVPMSLVDWQGNVVVVREATTPFFADEVGRILVTQAGGLGANAHYPMTGREAREAVIPDTISSTLELGKALQSTTDLNRAVRIVEHHTRGQAAFTGFVAELVEREAMGFLVQTARLSGTEQFSGQTVELVMKNEFMMASKDGMLGCVFPDLILLLDQEGRGVMSSELEKGQAVHMILAPCHPRMRETMATLAGAEALDSARYGHDGITYCPVELLSSKWGLSWLE